MTAFDLKRARALVKAGDRLGRKGLSEAVIAAVSEFDGSYKQAMNLAGRLQAIAQAAKADNYWREKVEDGFQKQFELLSEEGR